MTTNFTIKVIMGHESSTFNFNPKSMKVGNQIIAHALSSSLKDTHFKNSTIGKKSLASLMSDYVLTECPP